MYDNLVTTNTYAKMKGVTTECVRQWALQNKIKSVKIDGIRFIELSEEEMQERKKVMKEPKVGETYYAVPYDRRFDKEKYITVESVGRKYFTADHMKFNKNDFVQFNGGYSPDYELYDSKEQYELEEMANECWRLIRDSLYRKMTDEEVIELYEKLKDR